MVAFCRYLDSSGLHRIGVLESSEKNASNSPRVCPLADLVGDQQEQQWMLGNNLFDLTTDQIAAIPIPNEDQWQTPPDKFLPPIYQPEKIFCIGLNYLDHAIETGSEPPSEPVVFSKFNTSLIGHGEDIILPKISDQVDYEAELVVVIGKTARHIDASNALEHVFGYTCGHDVSARDWQKGRPGGQWLLAKSFQTFAPIGAQVVTANEVGSPADLRVKMLLNGETVQDSSTAQLIFNIPTLIAHLSRFMTLRPGDLIFTGTPPGVGAAKTPPRFLQPGDRCTVEIDRVGRLENPCVAESP